MAYFYGTIHQNDCSSVDWKTLRDFLCLVRSAAHVLAHYSAIADDKIDTIIKDVDATAKGAVRTLAYGM
ncbi:hypothetical protein TNCV_815931 [Trichonephila clavipes]|nr:hypothetical protein TNCV_815931 [Trichonephila clavipes]